MTQFNSPQMKNADNQNTVRRFSHQPMTIDHYGIHAKILENGRVIITGQAEKIAGEEVEYDEVEVPASLIFKLAMLLKATRTVKYVSVSEAEKLPAEDKE